ncbi:PTS system ascorbate-specific transporter subunit IIC [Citrobacter koseri]|nr:PTS system ascorbate-specific transporter subunit IIC [Citrobacter koseri]
MFILETLNFVVDILKVPSVLVGLIALIGLVAQKKAFSDVVKGTIKTILGFIVLGGGATVLVGSLNPLGGMFEHAFNIQGIIPNNEAIVSIALEKYGASTALIMAFGMVANIVVARFTRLKYIFLTGHHTFYMACMIGVILTVAGFDGVGLVFTGSLILGLVMAFFPALAQRYMKRITGTDDIAFGHFGTLGYVLSGWIGSLCGKGSRSTEEMNLPKKLKLPARQFDLYLSDHDDYLSDHGGGAQGVNMSRAPSAAVRTTWSTPSLWRSPLRRACSSSYRAYV